MRPDILALGWLAASALSALPALAEGTLQGRIVTFRVLAYDDPALLLFDGVGRTVRAGPGVEFGLEMEGGQNGLDVVPVVVNIGDDRIEMSYQHVAPGVFATATFNGYELRFDTECALFSAAEIDKGATTLPLDDTALRSERGSLFVNVAGHPYGRTTRIAIDLDVTDCPMS